ncbi:MAG TPA: transporter substrate-binding domain-containing protein [Pseudolabrys sp.]|jgi:cyclohexadienyl dehydratase|nr:transporter substrate-binding domain-containing protein [Pseudolabrys sp.]
MSSIPQCRSLCIGVALKLALAVMPGEARPLAAIKTYGTLKVGLTGDYAPYSLRDADGAIAGADVTMAQSLAKTLGVRLEIVPTTWKTMQADLQADRFDIAMGGVSVTPDRAAIGAFSVTVMRDGKRPIVRCTDKELFTSIAAIDRPGVRVVVNPGGTNERFAKAHFPHARLDEHADNRTIFDDLMDRQADVMVTDGAEVDYQARRHPGVLCPAAVADSFDHFDKAYWMTRDSVLKNAVDAWLEKALKAGDYQKALAAAADDNR